MRTRPLGLFYRANERNRLMIATWHPLWSITWGWLVCVAAEGYPTWFKYHSWAGPNGHKSKELFIFRRLRFTYARQPLMPRRTGS